MNTRPTRLLDQQSTDEEAFWLVDHFEALQDPRITTKDKIGKIISAAAYEAAWAALFFKGLAARGEFHGDVLSLDSFGSGQQHAMSLAWYAILRRGWMCAIDDLIIEIKLTTG